MTNKVVETASERYVLQQYLAEGGMGAIYLAKKTGVGGFEKDVVLKQLLPAHTSEPQFIDLFLREARLSAALDHANIVHTLDLVTSPVEGDGGDGPESQNYFIVMEYVRGADLRALLRRAKQRGKLLPPAAALHVGHGILDALTYAHTKKGKTGEALGIIHRDISPSNILLSGAGEVKLTDFGIAKLATHHSVFYRVKGKIGYMSPEQAKGQPLDARSDLYSLAVCVYEALVGERLFVADIVATPSAIYSQRVVPPSEKLPGLPREVDQLMLKALALDAGERFQSAEEFQEALVQVTYRHGLGCSSSEMASHLREACGPVEAWLEPVEPSERASGTAVLGDDEDSSPQGGGTRTMTLGQGTQLTSILGLRGASGAKLTGPRAKERSDEDEEELPLLEAPPGAAGAVVRPLERAIAEEEDRRENEPTRTKTPLPPASLLHELEQGEVDPDAEPTVARLPMERAGGVTVEPQRTGAGREPTDAPEGPTRPKPRTTPTGLTAAAPPLAAPTSKAARIRDEPTVMRTEEPTSVSGHTPLLPRLRAVVLERPWVVLGTIALVVILLGVTLGVLLAGPDAETEGEAPPATPPTAPSTR